MFGNMSKEKGESLNRLHQDTEELREIKDSLKALVKRNAIYYKAFDDLSRWVLKSEVINTDFVEEVQNDSGNSLMKYVRKTWMPIVESHFTEHIEPETGRYQYKAYKASLKYLKKNRNALDIGGNIGLWSRQMVNDFDMVHSFEPQHKVRACLARNVAASNIIIYPYGLGEKDEVISMVANDLNSGAAFVPQFADNSKLKENWKMRSEEIAIKTLDAQNITDVDYIKIDVQGFEINVLKGGEELLKREDPVVVVEAPEKFDELAGVDPLEAVKYLETLGYVQRERIGKDVVLTK